jgi:plasmanylethanolamine desaturase
VAAVAVPILLPLLAVPLDSRWGGPLVVFGLAFCALGSLTNQIHQWAHLPHPPALVRALQQCGVLLGRTEHAAHHARPYDRQYCITTGWCNRPLDAIGFFRRLESVVTAVTGIAARHDDRRYEQQYGIGVTGPELHREY